MKRLVCTIYVRGTARQSTDMRETVFFFVFFKQRWRIAVVYRETKYDGGLRKRYIREKADEREHYPHVVLPTHPPEYIESNFTLILKKTTVFQQPRSREWCPDDRTIPCHGAPVYIVFLKK